MKLRTCVRNGARRKGTVVVVVAIHPVLGLLCAGRFVAHAALGSKTHLRVARALLMRSPAPVAPMTSVAAVAAVASVASVASVTAVTSVAAVAAQRHRAVLVVERPVSSVGRLVGLRSGPR